MHPGHRTLTYAALAGGFLLGFLDFVWIKWMPYPFAELGNSSAVWAVAAFLYGYLVRSGQRGAAVGAAALLVVAVPSYHLAAALLQGDDLALLWAAPALLWMGFGVVAGAVFGVGGNWARADGRRQTVGAALPAAVLFAEAALLARRIGTPDYGTAPLWNVVIDVALGGLAVALLGRTNRRRAVVLATALPLAAIGLAGFLLAGFG